MARVSYTVHISQQLRRNLSNPDTLFGSALTTFMKAATGAHLRHARKEAPVGKGDNGGHLRDKHVVEIDRAAVPKWGRVRNTADHAKMVHDGTRPHTIRPRNAKALWWASALHPVKEVEHPGTKANPWMTRAFRQAQGEINGPVITRTMAALQVAWGRAG